MTMINKMLKVSARPLPLKQRTSSVDTRRDFNTQTWTSLLGLLKPREFLVTVDHFSIWRRHLAWAMENGGDLREYMTKRYASSMVFMSLLLSTELAVLFNSAGVSTSVRQALAAEEHTSIKFWVGICIILSAVLTILSLLSIFTAWTMVSSISNTNAHCILRSSVGQYAAELPGRFIVCSIYSFLLWLIMFFFILLPVGIYSSLLVLFVASLFVHTITTFSSFGRVIMHSSAMGSERIFDANYEMTLLPHGLHNNLLNKAKANLSNNTSIMRQYRSKQQPIDRTYSQQELSSLFLSDRLSSMGSSSSLEIPTPAPPPPPTLAPCRKRTGSLVRFADGCDTSGNPVSPPPARNDGKGKSSIAPNVLGAGGRANGVNGIISPNLNSRPLPPPWTTSSSPRDEFHLSTPTTRNTKGEQQQLNSSHGEHSPLLQEWLLSSNNSLPVYNDDSNNNNDISPQAPAPPPPPIPPHYPHYHPSSANPHSMWTANTPPPPIPQQQTGQPPQRPSLWSHNTQHQQHHHHHHAGYGATITANTAGNTTVPTMTATTTASEISSSLLVEDDVPARVGNRAYSMVSELSVDDLEEEDEVEDVHDDFYRHDSTSHNNRTVEHNNDKYEENDDYADDNGFEQEYGFDPDVSNGGKDEDDDDVTYEEELSSSQDVVHGLDIEIASGSEQPRQEPSQQHERATRFEHAAANGGAADGEQLQQPKKPAMTTSPTAANHVDMHSLAHTQEDSPK